MKKLTNQPAIRAAFWRENPSAERRRGRGHNGQTTDTRCAFVDWLDVMHRVGRVTDYQAHNATL